MKNRICKRCGTENEPEYNYCKNCGSTFDEIEEKPENNQFPDSNESQTSTIFTQPVFEEIPFAKEENHLQNAYTAQSADEFHSGFVIDGIPEEDIALFVGAKAQKICTSFRKMEISHKKVSWCWPVAILSFVLGPLGAALWFLYRKMYKIGFLLLGIGAITEFLTDGVMDTAGSSQAYESLLSAFMLGGTNQLISELNDFNFVSFLPQLIALLVKNTIYLAIATVTGLYTFNYYKNHCVKKIRSFINNIPDRRYYRVGLAAIGGVSGGMLAFGIICIVIITELISLISVLI